jgi:hypothetical protein
MTQELIDEYNRGLQDGVRMNTEGEAAYLKSKIAELNKQIAKASEMRNELVSVMESMVIGIRKYNIVEDDCPCSICDAVRTFTRIKGETTTKGGEDGAKE